MRPYAVSLVLAKAKKHFADGAVVKKCATEMAKAFGDSKIAEKFETVPLSNHTQQKRVTDMGEQVQKKLLDFVEKSSYFSLSLDESSDNTDVSQLLIFIQVTQEDFSSKEELLDICALHGTTKGKNIYGAVKNSKSEVLINVQQS